MVIFTKPHDVFLNATIEIRAIRSNLNRARHWQREIHPAAIGAKSNLAAMRELDKALKAAQRVLDLHYSNLL